jgi:hypothetical protein
VENQSAAEQANARQEGEIVVLNRDLFFGVRIGNLLRSAGYSVFFAQTTPAFIDQIRESRSAPVLGLIDMSAGVDWEAIHALTADPTITTPTLVFGPHKDVEGFRAAKNAGVTRVVSNGDFHRDALALVRRYARPAS